MKTIEKYKGKKRRAFLNPNDVTCTAAVTWNAYGDVWKDHNGKQRCEVEATITINREGSSHYVTRRADLKALQTMKKELDAFIEEATAAVICAEEQNKNAKS